MVNPYTDPNHAADQARMQQSAQMAWDRFMKIARESDDIRKRNAGWNSGLWARPARSRGAQFIGLILIAVIAFIWIRYGN